MPQGVLVTQQAGVHGVYSSFSLLWHLLPLSYSLWDICKEKREISSIAQLQIYIRGYDVIIILNEPGLNYVL